MNLIYFTWGANFLIIVTVILRDLKRNLRIYYLTKLRWKYDYLRPKIMKPVNSGQGKNQQLSAFPLHIDDRHSSIRSCKKPESM